MQLYPCFWQSCQGNVFKNNMSSKEYLNLWLALNFKWGSFDCLSKKILTNLNCLLYVKEIKKKITQKMIMIIFIKMKLSPVDVWNYYSDFKWGLKFHFQDNHRNLGIHCVLQYKDFSYFIYFKYYIKIYMSFFLLSW